MSNKVTKVLLSPWLALLTFALLFAVKVQDPFLVESARIKFYDYIMIDKPVESKDIVVINLGEKAIEKYGHGRSQEKFTVMSLAISISAALGLWAALYSCLKLIEWVLTAIYEMF